MATEDLYGDESPPSRPSRSKAKPKSASDESSDQTTTIAKSLCPGMDVGEKITFEIVSVLEDEYQVRYVKKDSDDDDDEDEEVVMMESSGPDDMYS